MTDITFKFQPLSISGNTGTHSSEAEGSSTLSRSLVNIIPNNAQLLLLDVSVVYILTGVNRARLLLFKECNTQLAFHSVIYCGILSTPPLIKTKQTPSKQFNFVAAWLVY